MPKLHNDKAIVLDPPPGPGDRRKLYKAFNAAHDQAFQRWIDSGYRPGHHLPEMPEELAGMQCGARTRAGTPCKRTGIYDNGRCRNHGGMSTGPKTPEGKSRSAANARRKPTHEKSCLETNPMDSEENPSS